MIPKISGVKLEYFSEGKHGIIYTGMKDGVKVAVKTGKDEIHVDSSIREAKMLEFLNPHGIGPKMLKAGKGYVMYEFVEGVYFDDWQKSCTKDQMVRIMKKLFLKCYALDKLGIRKNEFTRPTTNVIVMKGNIPKLIDFERALFSSRPGNVNQLAQFYTMHHRRDLKDGFIDLAKQYKKDYSQKSFDAILNYLEI